MEGLPNSESVEQVERRKWLVANLAGKGEMDPEVQETLKAWTAAEEQTRQALNEPNYLLTMELARIFEEAGLSSTADYLLEIAGEDALLAGDLDTFAKIKKALGMP